MKFTELSELVNTSMTVSKILSILANKDRLMLLCYLTKGEYCVGELEESLQIVQPTLSQQLGILRRSGMIKNRRDGKQIFYSLSDAKTAEIIKLLHQLYCTKELKGKCLSE